MTKIKDAFGNWMDPEEEKQLVDESRESWKERYWEYVNEMKRYIPEESDETMPTFFFGYRTSRNDEIFTITDYGNVEKFIELTLSFQKQKIIEICESKLKTPENEMDFDAVDYNIPIREILSAIKDIDV